jgi:hypothetical protein
MAERKPRLNQIVAIEKGTKQRVNSEGAVLLKQYAKPVLFKGITREYEPLQDDGEQFPEENQKVQAVAEDSLQTWTDLQKELWDLVLTKDKGNCIAKADIVIDNEVIAESVPATTLLFLEKQLDDLRKFIDAIPTLDPAYDWQESGGTGLAHSKPVKTHKTKKVHKPVTLVEATEEHPAQAQLVTEDVTIGHWSTTRISGEMSVKQKKSLAYRATKLRNALKEAREQANMTEVDKESNFAKKLLDYVTG